MKNPFQPTRWERHTPEDALIWFSPIAERIAEPRSFYISGTRGSGKTTILRSVHWMDLLENHSLKSQRSIADFEQIGIYLRFPDHVSSMGDTQVLREMFSELPNADRAYGQYFSLIIELLCAAKALEAIHALRVAGIVSATANSEVSICADFRDRFPELFVSAGARSMTFFEMARLVERVASQMNQALHRGLAIDVLKAAPPREIGALLNYVCDKLSGSTRLATAKGEIAPAFRFCLDDCEALSPVQQRTVNTLVRISKYPIYWVIAYVGSLVNNRTTFIEAQPLTDADRANITLDTQTDAEFSRLCQSVVDFRLAHALPPSHRMRKKTAEKALFPLERILGPYGINKFFEWVTENRDQGSAQELRAAALALSRLDKKQKADAAAEKVLPYYEAYVLAHWLGREDSFSLDADYGARFNKSARFYASSDDAFRSWMRRKQRAAFVHYMSRFCKGERLPYCGSQVAISLADGCIRDFLDIMASIFDHAVPADKRRTDFQASLERFASPVNPIARATQERALSASSRAFLEGIRSRVDEPEAIAQLVEGLSALTHELQGSWEDTATLGSPERGIFDVDFRSLRSSGRDQDREVAEFVLNLLNLAELAGMLKFVHVRRRGSAEPLRLDAPGNVLPANRTVRVHRRLAIEHRFSPRGAYNIVSLPAAELAVLCGPGQGVQARKWAADIYRRLYAQRYGGGDDQFSLFSQANRGG